MHTRRSRRLCRDDVFAASGRDDWTLNLDMTAPESVVIRVFAADGALLRESEHTIDWTPPTGQCGGASTAPPIVLAG